jgi:hypothetical protein
MGKYILRLFALSRHKLSFPNRILDEPLLASRSCRFGYYDSDRILLWSLEIPIAYYYGECH